MVDYRTKDAPIPTSRYSESARKSLILGADGEHRASLTNPVPVTTGTASFSAYESAELAPGASADGYDVKTTGSMFGAVETSYRTIITNNDTAETITVYLNIDDANPISIGSASTFEVNSFAVTDIFIDTTSGQTGTVEIILFG